MKAWVTLGNSVIVFSGPLFLVISHEIEQGLLMQRDTSVQDVSGKQIPPSNLQGWTLHPLLMVTGLKITTGADADFLYRFLCHFVFHPFLLSFPITASSWHDIFTHLLRLRFLPHHPENITPLVLSNVREIFFPPVSRFCPYFLLRWCLSCRTPLFLCPVDASCWKMKAAVRSLLSKQSAVSQRTSFSPDCAWLSWRVGWLRLRLKPRRSEVIMTESIFTAFNRWYENHTRDSAFSTRPDALDT